MEQVRKKLIDDGTNEEIIALNKDTKLYEIKKEFSAESFQAYGSIVSAVYEYFELFKKSANKLEYIILEMHKRLKIKPFNSRTFIHAIHYKVYLVKVIEVQGVKEILD